MKKHPLLALVSPKAGCADYAIVFKISKISLKFLITISNVSFTNPSNIAVSTPDTPARTLSKTTIATISTVVINQPLLSISQKTVNTTKPIIATA